jgi:hypothetical protein
VEGRSELGVRLLPQDRSCADDRRGTQAREAARLAARQEREAQKVKEQTARDKLQQAQTELQAVKKGGKQDLLLAPGGGTHPLTSGSDYCPLIAERAGPVLLSGHLKDCTRGDPCTHPYRDSKRTPRGNPRRCPGTSR